MKRHNLVTLGLLLFAFCLAARVDASIYTGGGADPNDWFDDDNWDESGAFGGPGDAPELGPGPNFGATFGDDSFTFNQVAATAEFLVIGSTGGRFPFNIEGGDLTYGGDGLFGINGFDGATFGAATINHTAGVLKQVAGGAGMFIGHSQPATYNISGGMLIMETVDRQLGIDSPDFGGSGNASFLNITGTGFVEVKEGVNIRIGPAGVLDILDEGQLIWRNRTLADVSGLGGTIRATAAQVGPDVVFTTDRSPDVLLVMNVDRDTGAIDITNSTGGPVDIASYSIVSQAGTLSSANWTSIAATGDSDSGGSIDGDDVWNEFTAAGSSGDLSEGTVGTASIADGGTLSLDDGVSGAWSPYIVEKSDLTFQYLTGNGEVLGGLIEFTGNGGEKFAFGDLNFDGLISSLDWDAFVEGYGTDLTDLSGPQLYQRADLNEDRVHNLADFQQFKQVFDLTNGPGAFAAMLAGVPEPSSVALTMLGLLGGLMFVRKSARRERQSLFVAALTVTLASIFLSSSAALAATYTGTGADPADWFDAGNWDGGVPSQSGGNGAVFSSGTPYAMTAAGTTGADSLFLVVGGPDTLTIQGGDLTYTGDGLFGTTVFGVGGDTNLTQTGGTIIQQGGGAGLLIGHNAASRWDISGGQLEVQATAPSLTVDWTLDGSASAASSLNISGTGVVDVASRVHFGRQSALNVTGNGVLIWRDHTVADVFGTLSGAAFEGVPVFDAGATINGEPTQVGTDVHFVPGSLGATYTGLGANPADWFDAGNWDGGVSPQSGSKGAVFVSSTPYTVTAAGTSGADSQFLVVGGPNSLTVEGGEVTYTGDGLIGTTAYSAGGETNVTQTGGTFIQQGGGVGLLVGHNAGSSWDISGGQIEVQATAPSLTVDWTLDGSASAASSLNISGTAVVDVASRLHFGPQSTLNVTGDGVLIWRDHTVADVFGTLSGGDFEGVPVIDDGATINAEPTQVGPDVHFVPGFTEIVDMTLTIDLNDGSMDLTGGTRPDDINFYEITSALNSLTPASSVTTNLDAQEIDKFGDESNESWSTLTATDSNLTEAFLSGSSIFDASRTESLGLGYDTSIDARDLVMLVGTTDGQSREVSIVYDLGPDILGDLNMDGFVDGLDLGILLGNFNQVTDAAGGELNGTPPVDGLDLGILLGGWNPPTVSATTSVPEPASWVSLLLAIVVVASLSRTRAVCYARVSNRRVGAAGAIVVTLGLFALGPQLTQAGTVERDYLLGDDSQEGAALGGVVGDGPGNVSPGATLDSFGPLPGTFLDIGVTGNPTYTNVSDRPGAGPSELGAAFDGNDDALRAVISMNSPTGMVNNLQFFPTGYLRDYTGIFAHGMQLWAKPTSGSLNGQRQDLIIDTPQHGIVIAPNTVTVDEVEVEIDAWALQFAGQLVVSEVAVDTASNNGWTHVMQLAGFADVSGGKSSTGGALLVNGVAVAASASSYVADGSSLSIASNQANDDNFYDGTLDNVQLFLWGDNSGNGPFTLDWGPLDLAVDNDWIAQQFADKAAAAGVGSIPAGDINFDGQVSGDGSGPAATDDVTAFIDNWLLRNVVDGVQVGDWNSRQNADLNFDGGVDLFDWKALRDAHPAGLALNLGALLAAVPEPGSLGLAVVGLLCLCHRARRGARQA